MNGGTVFDLKRTTLKNVDDDAGRWQYEGGAVFKSGTQVGNYMSTKRVIFDVSPALNAAMLTLTIFFSGEDPPQNITLQGTHDFNNGGEIGSVSAASLGCEGADGALFSRVGDTLTIMASW